MYIHQHMYHDPHTKCALCLKTVAIFFNYVHSHAIHNSNPLQNFGKLDNKIRRPF